MAKKHNIKSFRLTIPEGSSYGSVLWTPGRSVLVYNIKLVPLNIKLGDLGLLEFIYNGQTVSTFGEEGIMLVPQDEVDIKFPQDDIVNIIYPLEAKFSVTATDNTGRDLMIWIQYKE